MELSINGEKKKVLKRGDTFGDLALLYNSTRTASIKALDNCNLWAIHRTTFN
jgi:CRP-like cAMP-binding protein